MTKNYKDIHHLFTNDLVKRWQEKSFSFEQTANWINIYSPHDQAWAINNPNYHVWLRDIKKKQPLWILNYGDKEILLKEYNLYQFNKLRNLNTPSQQPTFLTINKLLIMVGLSLLTIYLLTKTYD